MELELKKQKNRLKRLTFEKGQFSQKLTHMASNNDDVLLSYVKDLYSNAVMLAAPPLSPPPPQRKLRIMKQKLKKLKKWQPSQGRAFGLYNVGKELASDQLLLRQSKFNLNLRPKF